MLNIILALLMIFGLISCNPTGSKSIIEIGHSPYLNPPGTFIISSAVKGLNSLTLTWTNSGGADRYVLKYRETTQSSFSTISDSVNSPYTLQNLDQFKSYTIMIVAQNLSGETQSNTYTGSPMYINSAPGVLDFTAASFDEDTESIIQLPYFDIDSDLAVSCSVSSLQNAVVSRACQCDLSGVCSVGIRGNLNYNGIGSFRYSVADQSISNTAQVTFTINSINDSPTMSPIANQTTNEDTQAVVNFNIDDPDNTLTCSGSIAKSSSDTSKVTLSGIVLSGTVPNCVATITPVANAAGVVTVGFTVSDGSLTSAKSFTLTLNPVNDAPAISVISSQTTNEDTPKVINFTIDDVDNTLSCSSSIARSSSDTTKVAVSGIVFSGTAPNCVATITPVADASGVVTIGFNVTDGSLSSLQSFTLTVDPVNDAPTISAISAQTTNEDTPKVVNFTIGDVDNILTCGAVTGTSSNQSNVQDWNIIISGTAPNCVATITPVANATGVVTIGLTVTDGSLSSGQSFTLTLTPVNDAPVISAISSQTTNEDTPKVVNFTIYDVDNTLTCSGSISRSSSDTTKVAVSGIVFSGTAPNCVATITPVADASGAVTIGFTVSDGSLSSLQSFALTVDPVNDAPTISAISAQTTNEDTPKAVNFTIDDVDNTLTCSGSIGKSSSDTSKVALSGIVFSGTAPNCVATITPVADATGVVNIGFTVTDGTLSSSQNFALTINPINDAPMISAISAQSTNEDTPKVVNFTIYDVDNTLTCSGSISRSSSDTTKVAVSGIVFSGTAPNCVATITPVADASGAVTIGFTVTDGSLSSLQSFTLTVDPVNDAPTISAISAQTTNEDIPKVINFTIDDVDNTLTCSGSIGKSTSDTSKVALSGIVFSGTAPSCVATITPVADATGVVNLGFTVTDGTLSSSQNFALTLNPVNDAPTISTISTQITDEDTSKSVNFTINDVDNTLTCSSSIAKSSSDTTKVAVSGIVFSGTAPNCVATVTPAANQNGSVTLTFTVSDGTLSYQSSFTLNINSVPDVGGALAFSGVADTNFTRLWSFSSLTLDETIDRVEICISEDVDLNGSVSAGEKCNTQTWLDVTSNISAANTSSTSGWSSYRLQNNVNGASFITALVASCSTTRSYVNHIRVRSSASANWGELASSAWNFWLPNCQANMAIWLDGQDTSTIFSNTGCTTTITSASKVACWKDKSSNARHVTQSTASSQPTYYSSLINGNPGITFLYHVLQTATSASWLSNTPYTLIAVVNNLSPTKNLNFFFGTSAVSTNLGLHWGRRIPTTLTIAQYANDIDYSITASTGVEIHIGMKSSSASASRLYGLNGTLLTPSGSDGSSSYLGAITQPLNVGAGFGLTTGTGGPMMDGNYGEGIIYTTGLTSAIRQRVEGYLAHKWGNTSSLPAAHPYKSSPP